jgi:hypothetical protein
MRRTIALLVTMILVSASIFAAPAVSIPDETYSKKVAVSGNQEQTAIETSGAIDETASLFADVEAIALTDSEASQAEGGCWLIVASIALFVTVVLITH